MNELGIDEISWNSHSENIKSVVLLGGEPPILVSCSTDKTIKIWDYNSGKLVHTIKKKEPINHTIKWDSETILCCWDTHIESISIKSPFSTLKTFDFNRVEVYQLLKLNKKFFLSLSFDGRLVLCEYQTGDVPLKRLKLKHIILVEGNLWKSISHSFCLYFSNKLFNSRRSVSLFDCESTETLRKFNEHTDSEITTICTFLNSRNEEILVCGGIEGVLYFYNTTIVDEGKKKLIRKFEFDHPLSISINIGRSLLIGDSNGYLNLIQIIPDNFENGFGLRSITEKKVHEKSISSISVVFSSSNCGYFKVVTSSVDTSIKSVQGCALFENIISKEQGKCVRNLGLEVMKRVFRDLQMEENYPNVSHFFFQKGRTVKEIKDFRNELCNEIRRLAVKIVLKPNVEKEKNEEEDHFFESFPFFEAIEEFFQLINIHVIEPTENKSSIYLGTAQESESDCLDLGIRFMKKKKVLGSTTFSPVYVGEFSVGKYEGKGTLYDLKSRRILYDGDFQCNEKSGKGLDFCVMEKEMVVEYEGEFLKNERHGRGEIFDVVKGTVFKAFWKVGKLEEDTISGAFECPLFTFRGMKKYLTNEKMIGIGGFGAVYKVRASCIPGFLEKTRIKDEFVAVKIMKVKNLSEMQLLFKMTQRGIGLVSSFGSKHVLEVFGVVRGVRELGYVMKLCVKSIDKVIADEDLDMNEKIRLLHETALGMKSLHNVNVMHRDLKWGNVLVTSKGSVRITDFDTLKEDEQRWRVQRMSQSSCIGTPGFIAPEVFRGKSYSLACDVFAYGLMIYALLFDKNQPFITQYQCSCGNLMNNILSSNSLDYHVSNCNLRPLLDPKEVAQKPEFLIDIMIHSWCRHPKKRPSFDDILFRFEIEKKKTFHCFYLKFPQMTTKNQNMDQKMFLMKDDFRVLSVKIWVEKKFEGAKVLELSHPVCGTLEEDQDLMKIVEMEKMPVVVVKLDRVDSGWLDDEVDDEREVLHVKNEEMRKKFEDVRRLIGEIKIDGISGEILKNQIIEIKNLVGEDSKEVV